MTHSVNLQRLNVQRALFLLVGVAIGAAGSGWLPHTPLHATATHGQDNFTLATGSVDEEVEAVFFLDFLTGDLKAAVLNTRTHKFTAFYKYNILKDLGAAGVKNPRYLMVTGRAALQRGANVARIGTSVVYVCEVSSGRVMAYGVPWVPGRAALGNIIKAELVPLDGVQFRDVELRRE